MLDQVNCHFWSMEIKLHLNSYTSEEFLHNHPPSSPIWTVTKGPRIANVYGSLWIELVLHWYLEKYEYQKSPSIFKYRPNGRTLLLLRVHPRAALNRNFVKGGSPLVSSCFFDPFHPSTVSMPVG